MFLIHIINVRVCKTIAAHFDGDEYTEEELDKIKEFADFVRMQRKYKDGIELISNNPTYEPMEFSNKQISDKPVRI